MSATPNQEKTIPSFVPHGTSKAKHRNSSGLLIGISFIIFLLSVTLAVGVYFYEGFLASQLENKKKEVAQVESNIDFRSAEELIRLSKRLEYSRDLLAQHVAISPFFTELERVTLPSVQFTTLDFTRSGEKPLVKLGGKAKSYSAIALQSDEFGKTTIFKNPIFSNFKPQENGEIEFMLEMNIDPTLFVFTNSL